MCPLHCPGPGNFPRWTAALGEGAGSLRFGVDLVPGGWGQSSGWLGLKYPSSSFLSTQSVAHIRVKRYRQSMNQGSRNSGCRFGTCTVQKLAHQIYQFTDKDKDGVAPRSKISPHGYGRRRRRSLPEILLARTVVSSQEQTHAAPASQAQSNHLQAH